MRWGFSRRVWLFLFGSFVHGLGQAFMLLFLNFYLKALGLQDSYTGLVNALPAFTTAGLALPAVYLSRRFGEIRQMKWGMLSGLFGLSVIALASGPLVALIGSLFYGIGGALLMIVIAPFMAKESEPSNRVVLFSLQMALVTGSGFIGNLIGGRIPEIYSGYAGVAATSLPALRAALIAAVLIQSTGLIAVVLIPNDPVSHEKTSRTIYHLQVENKRLMAFLVIPNMLIGIGAGLTIPYLNLFVQAKFGVDFKTLGSLFGWTSLATAATVLIQPMLVRKLGHLKTGLLVEVASLPFLALMAYSPYFGLVTLAMFTRGALMNATGPAWNSYAMDHLSFNDRPAYSALSQMSWQITWAIAAALSGVFRQWLGPMQQVSAFHYLFAGTMLAYGLSMVLKYFWLYLPDKKARAINI